MFKRIAAAFFLILILCTGCSSWVPSKGIKVGIDPTFFSSPVGNRQGLVYAYIVELFEEIFEKSHYVPEFVELSFDNVIESLDNCTIDLAITSMEPNVTNKSCYNFSEMFLSLGDVFVTRSDMSFNFKKFDGKIIAIQPHPNIIPLFANYPAVKLTYYAQIPDILTKITNFSVDGALIPYLNLASNLSNEYKYFLKVDTSKYYSQTGLRLISPKKINSRLIHIFNHRLSSLSSKRKDLLRKWNLVL